MASGATASSATRHASTHRLIPASGQGVLPKRNATVTSKNWSGYAVVARGVTEVRGSFVVPSVKPFPAGFAATWTGIGGYGDNTLIQAGIAEESPGSYYAWYEILPASATQISGCVGDASCTVGPGDRTYVRIYLKTGSLWTISIVNFRPNVRWTWTRDIVYASTRASAEWILEAPTVGGFQSNIANVGKVSFGPSNVYKAGGVLRSIAGGHPVSIILRPRTSNAATPSALAADGQRFNDCTYRQTCPAP
jgi:hypothetical protein